MRLLITTVLLSACLGMWAQADNAADDNGFVELFNGKDLRGWKIWGDPNGYRVEDGLIRSVTGWGHAYGMYYTKKEFGDFILKIDWRVAEKGNSGVFIRVPTVEGPPQENHPWVTGYEVQISCEEPRRDDAHCTGSLYGFSPVTARPAEEANVWRTYEITCRGDLIAVKIDGALVNEFDQSAQENTKDKAKIGYIGLQDSHGPEGTMVEYRNIRIKEL